MKITYEKTTIENVFNALNQLQLVGISNAEIITYITNELKQFIHERDASASESDVS